MNSLQYFRRRSQFMILFLFLGLFVSCSNGGGKAGSGSASAENVTAALENAPEVTFEKLAHDFGPIFSGEKVTYNFRFTNTGNAPLIIINTRSGCGCTVGDYPKEPIPPGGEARVKVMFNSAGRRGFQSESVRVVTNATPQEYLLRITAEVIQN
jgi:hypothetical protein